MAEEQILEKVNLNDGLPKRKAIDIINELKDELYSDNNMDKFFPEERMLRIQANFNLFDRDNDEHINLSELKELLISIN